VRPHEIVRGHRASSPRPKCSIGLTSYAPGQRKLRTEFCSVGCFRCFCCCYCWNAIDTPLPQDHDKPRENRHSHSHSRPMFVLTVIAIIMGRLVIHRQIGGALLQINKEEKTSRIEKASHFISYPRLRYVYISWWFLGFHFAFPLLDWIRLL